MTVEQRMDNRRLHIEVKARLRPACAEWGWGYSCLGDTVYMAPPDAGAVGSVEANGVQTRAGYAVRFTVHAGLAEQDLPVSALHLALARNMDEDVAANFCWGMGNGTGLAVVAVRQLDWLTPERLRNVVLTLLEEVRALRSMYPETWLPIAQVAYQAPWAG